MMRKIWNNFVEKCIKLHFEKPKSFYFWNEYGEMEFDIAAYLRSEEGKHRLQKFIENNEEPAIGNSKDF